MSEDEKLAVRRDFAVWSGGFPPESEQEIFVYVEYAREMEPESLVREILREWLEEVSR